MTDNVLENNDNNASLPKPEGEADARLLQTGPGGAANWMDQDPLLRDMWTQGLSPEVISEKLHRSVAAIMTRAARLGLPRRFAPGRKSHQVQGGEGVEKCTTPKVRAPRKKRTYEDLEAEPLHGQEAMRVCLMCLRKFKSEGRHNRICPACKGSPEYVAGNRVPDAIFGDG